MLHQNILQEALNLNSVMGLALIQKGATPYFCVKDHLFPEQKRLAVACFIGNILGSQPEGIDSFEFPVMDYYGYAYQLKPQVTLVILARQQDLRIKLLAIKKWQPIIEDNIDQFLAFFEAVAQKQATAMLKAQATAELKQETVSEPPAPPPSQSAEPDASLATLLQDLNHLSEAVSQYLGPQLTAKYWHSSRPQYAWLQNFEIAPLAEITYSGDSQHLLTAANHLCIRQWSNTFMKQCSQIVQDLPQKIEQHQTNQGHQYNLSIVPLGTLTRLANLEPEEKGLFWD
ncbi:MAG: hypothetical protein WA902_20715 [Thermosynechococcaceae cyanobacterium]